METWLSGTLWILPPQRRKQLLSRKTCSCCISVNCLLLWEVDLRLNATFSCTKSWQFLIHFSLAWYSYCVVGGHLRLFPQVYSWLWNENISGGDNKLTEFAEFIQINDMMYSQWFSRCWLNSSAVIMAAWSSMVGEDCHVGHMNNCKPRWARWPQCGRFQLAWSQSLGQKVGRIVISGTVPPCSCVGSVVDLSGTVRNKGGSFWIQ